MAKRSPPMPCWASTGERVAQDAPVYRSPRPTCPCEDPERSSAPIPRAAGKPVTLFIAAPPRRFVEVLFASLPERVTAWQDGMRRCPRHISSYVIYVTT